MTTFASIEWGECNQHADRGARSGRDAGAASGHEVTLFATGDSETKATLVAPLDEPPTRPGRRTNGEVHHALTCLKRAEEFDVVSSHLRVVGAAVYNGGAPPFVHTVSDPIDKTAETWRLAAATGSHVRLISVSRRQHERPVPR